MDKYTDMFEKIGFLTSHAKKVAKYTGEILRAGWLPIFLVVIFVIQNHLFNAFLDISTHEYFIRRTIVTTAFGVLIFGSGLLLNKWSRYFYQIIVSLIIGAFFIVQFIYYSYSGGFLQTSALFSAGEGITVLSTAKTLLTYKLLFFIIGPLVTMIAWVCSFKKIITDIIFVKKEKIIIATTIVVFVFSGYLYLFIRENMEAGNVSHLYQYNKLYDVNALVSKMGIVNFSIGDMASYIFTPTKATAAEIDMVKTYKENFINSTTTSNFGVAKGRNLILIQVESLENAVIGQNIDGQEIAPNLNKLSKDGLYFTNYYAPIGPGPTADAEFSILNSLYPLPDRVAFIQYAYNQYNALPNLLRENNYHTYSFHGDVSSFWNRSNIYPQLGYEKFFDKQYYTIPRKIGVYGLGDKDFFEQSIPKLKLLPQPFLATLITLTSHTPFILPDDLKTLHISTTSSLNVLQQNYLQSIHYTDQAIGDFIDQLKLNGLYNNSLIFIYGDHTSLTKIDHALNVKNSVFSGLQPTQVPMIILVPGTNILGKSYTPTSHMDVYPTATNLLGIKPPPNIFGHDMINGKEAIVISRNLISGTITSIITNDLAYQATSDGVFEHGLCLDTINAKKYPVENCHALYNDNTKAVEVSDLMIKGNLITSK